MSSANSKSAVQKSLIGQSLRQSHPSPPTKLQPVIPKKKQTLALPKDIYKIMVVDDSNAYVKRFKKVLERTILSYQGKTLVVLTVSDPAKALQLMTKEHFSLCFLDNIFQDSSLSGIEMCNRMNMVEEETKQKFSPRILISGEPPLSTVTPNLTTVSTTTTNTKKSQSTETLLRIEKKEVGVGLLYDLLRVYGKCLTIIESNDISLPLLSGCTRNRLTTGKSGVGIMFWGSQKIKQMTDDSADGKDTQQQDFVKFLDLPPVLVRNQTTKRRMVEGGAALVNTSQWDVKNIQANNEFDDKLTYKYLDQKRRTSAVIFVNKPKAGKINALAQKQNFWKQLRKSVRTKQINGPQKKKHEKVGSEAYTSQMKKDIQLFQYIGSTMTDPSAMAPVL